MTDLHSLEIRKFPRTPHLEGSRLQQGDDASWQVPLQSLAGRYACIEEKVDAANCGLSFSAGGDLLLQSRGHYLTGGGGERQFNALKPWAHSHCDRLMKLLDDQYVLYGEWMYAKHALFYDLTPHMLLEFDVLDRRTGKFLSTKRRRELLAGSPVVSVPVLYEGLMPTDPRLLWSLVRHSLAKSTSWRERFEAVVHREKLPLHLCWQQTDASDLAEGLYIKIENDDYVEERFKLVRHDFVQAILDSGSHHLTRPIIPNQLADGVDLFAPQPTVTFHDLGLRTICSLEELRAQANDHRRRPR